MAKVDSDGQITNGADYLNPEKGQFTKVPIGRYLAIESGGLPTLIWHASRVNTSKI